jgi:hypothetical protein
MDRRMDGRTDGWMDGRMDRDINLEWASFLMFLLVHQLCKGCVLGDSIGGKVIPAKMAQLAES